MDPQANMGPRQPKMPGVEDKIVGNLSTEKPAMRIDTVLDIVKSKFEKGETEWNRLPRNVKDFIKPDTGKGHTLKKKAQGSDTTDQKENILHELARRTSDFGEPHAS